LTPFLSGCVWLAVGAGVAAVSAARQERTIGNAINDTQIKSQIVARLQNTSADMFLNVSVTSVEGRVLLTGRVVKPDTRLSASRVAWSVEGVRRVDNEIEVTDQAGWLDRPQDIYIRTRVAAILLGDKSIKDVNYTVDCVNQVVYLTGVGQDQAEVNRAIAQAKSVAGVKRVESFVVLKDDPSRYGFAPRQ
jgi:osmotically-inducible protein OsmY